MKSSTFGIGIVFLVIAVGAGLRYCSENHWSDVFSPGERQNAWVEELDGMPPLPEPLPTDSVTRTSSAKPRYTPVSHQTASVVESEGQSDSARLVPRQDNGAPEYIVRGQLPGQLTRKDLSKPNPLRDEDEEPNVVAPRSLPAKTAQEPVPMPQTAPPQPPSEAPPLPEPKSISQTGIQAEGIGFGASPTPTPAQSGGMLESAGFPAAPAAQPQPPVEQASPLRTADPFAAESNVNALPPVVPTPKPQVPPQVLPQTQPPMQSVPPSAPRAENLGPIASGHAPPMDRSVSAVEPSVEFGRSPATARSANQLRMSEGTGLPGASVLEGAQTPHLTLEKILPPEIIIEQPATIKLKIKNTGRSAAKSIQVMDRVPQGTRLLSTTPETSPDQNGELVWSLGSLDPGEELNVEMRILPLREGEIGSVATVNYTAEASARVLVARPMLQVDVKVPSEVRLGEVVNLEIAISNPGTATATGIVLVEHIPDGLYHKDGKILENRNIDTLKPKEKKILVLPLTCTGAGNLVNHLVVKANNNLAVEEKTTIRALSPTLELSIAGPRQRFLERKATYKLVVSNTGTATAQNVDLKVTLPQAVKFVSTNQSGVYEAQTHTVHWALEELPAQEAGEIELIVLPTQIGEHSIRFAGLGQNNLKAEDVKTMAIDGLPALSFEVLGSSNLVEVGKDVTYEIRVANKGTKSASNVRIQAALSDGIAFIKADGSPCQTRGNVVVFSPIAQLEAKGEKVFKILARCNADGDHRISVQVVSDDLSSPITKEESTRVFQ